MSKIYILHPKTIGNIAPEIYGHFTEHIGGVFYDGLYVGKDHKCADDNGFRKYIIEKLRDINAPVLRWPGGCFAETYDWRDGIGQHRPVRYNWWTKRDGRYEPNAVGTHEFMALCESVGAKPYFAANVTSSTPRDIIDWMDYCLSPKGTTELSKLREQNGREEPFDIPYFGVGNENWGGGGNMRPEYYADIYRQYAELMYNMPFDTSLIAGGANGADYNWTHKFMESFEDAHTCRMHGYSFHYYCSLKDEPIDFTPDGWYGLLKKASRMETLIDRHFALIKGLGLEKQGRLVIDEWGVWHKDGSGPSKGCNLFEQQSTMRDAAVTALTLNIFNNNCDKVMMANAAQLVNNLHCLFLAADDKCITTPTYHVFDMFKTHMNGRAVATVTECDKLTFELNGETAEMDSLSVSASVKDGVTTLTVANLSHDNAQEIELCHLGAAAGNNMTVKTLSHSDIHAHNTFDDPDNVTLQKLSVTGNKITLPPASIMSIQVETK